MVVAPAAAARAVAESRASVAEGTPVERRRSFREARASAEEDGKRESSLAKSRPATTDVSFGLFLFFSFSLPFFSCFDSSFPSPSFLSSTARYSVDFRANSAPKPASGTRPPAPRERQPFASEEEFERDEEAGKEENAHEGEGSAGRHA